MNLSNAELLQLVCMMVFIGMVLVLATVFTKPASALTPDRIEPGCAQREAPVAKP